MIKEFLILAGANGSGKSTLSNFLLKEYDFDLVNADDIAKSISPDDLQKARVRAGKIAINTLMGLFDEGKSFVTESTLSGNFLIRVINRAKDLKYKVSLFYVFLDNPDMCIERVKTRFLKGGHNVAEKDVTRRYYRSKDNFWNKYRSIVDEYSVFYNGLKTPLLVMKNNDILNEKLYKLFTKDIEC